MLTENLIRTEEYASSALGGISINFDNVGGKELASTVISENAITDIDPETGLTYVVKNGLSSDTVTALTAVILAFPVVALILGIVVCIRRRYL